MLTNNWQTGINGVADQITQKEYGRYKKGLEGAEKKYDHGLQVEYKGRGKKALKRKVAEGRKVVGMLEMDKQNLLRYGRNYEDVGKSGVKGAKGKPVG